MDSFPHCAHHFDHTKDSAMSDAPDAPNAVDSFGMVDGQSLDGFVGPGAKAARRQSMPISYGGPSVPIGAPDVRRMSMMSFGDGAPGSLQNYGFSMDGIVQGDSAFPSAHNPPVQPPSGSDLAINTQFAPPGSPYTSMPPPASAFASSLHSSGPMDLDMANSFPEMHMPLDLNDTGLTLMGTDMNFLSQPQFAAPIFGSAVAHDFISASPVPQDPSATQLPDQHASAPFHATHDVRSSMSPRTNSHENSGRRSAPRSQSEMYSCKSVQTQSTSGNTPSLPVTTPSRPGTTPTLQGPTPLPAETPMSATTATLAGAAPLQPPDPSRAPQPEVPVEPFHRLKFPWTTPPGGFPSSMNSRPHMETSFKNAYSSTGFDMLGVLMRVATRTKPEIDIGSVDLSCAFVVCDAQAEDNPIVYCSENFERLTGYDRFSIRGRNCRFLQSPDGYVEPGVKRNFVDDDSVYQLKRAVWTKQESQMSLINYRRGGQPFMNLLTMIPIPWDTDKVKFIVGFQVDLVEQPGSMINKNPDGSFRVNYQRGLSMPSYVFNPDAHYSQPDQGLMTNDEVSNLLAAYSASGDSEFTKPVWDKVLIENTDDVIHVLSLKGIFQYLSPSSKKVLEYEPSELVHTALSSICHPSDIVPVTRELKETAGGNSVNVVFRIRRKRSGYMWFEGHGSLHTEQGKGRKCIVLVGRERPVYTLSKTIVRASGGVGDSEIWSKLSTSGMFLFVSSNVRALLEKQPEELVGTSMQTGMRVESRKEFNESLEVTRAGRKTEVKHEIMHKRGNALHAFTILYPGDANEGQKPTFLVGQTRLLKYTRNNSQRGAMTPKDRNSGDSPLTFGSATHGQAGSSTGHAMAVEPRFTPTRAMAVTFAGQHGLAIGRQDQSLASAENGFDELKTTRSTSWQYELRQMEKRNRYLADEVQTLSAAKKKRKRRKGSGQLQKDCANCHTRNTPEWRRGPSGNRDLCNSCGLRYAKQNGRVSPRASSQHSQQSDKSKKSASPRHAQALGSTTISDTMGFSSTSPAVVAGEKRSPQPTTVDSHAVKAARRDVPSSPGLASGIPPKIDEASEPD